MKTLLMLVGFLYNSISPKVANYLGPYLYLISSKNPPIVLKMQKGLIFYNRFYVFPWIIHTHTNKSMYKHTNPHIIDVCNCDSQIWLLHFILYQRFSNYLTPNTSQITSYFCISHFRNQFWVPCNLKGQSVPQICVGLWNKK